MQFVKVCALAALVACSGFAHAHLGGQEENKTPDLYSQVTSLDSAWEYYSGNRQSSEALKDLRRQLMKFHVMGFTSAIEKLDSISDDDFKKAVDQKMELALNLRNPRECSLVVMTLVALSQGLCAKRPEFHEVPQPQTHVTGDR